MSFKDYFAFTKGEKRGVIVLLFLIVALTISINCIKFLKINEFTDFSKFDDEISIFEKERLIQQNSENHTLNSSNKSNYPSELFTFNPNEIEDSNWLKLGFAPWQIKTINNYKAKGGQFRLKSDIRKIFGVTDTLYQLLYPYILLPDLLEKHSSDLTNKKTTNIVYFSFDPNNITKEQWEKLGFAAWQIKAVFNYKEKGGIWKTKTDFKKLYGLSESDYYKLEPFILLPDEISKTETLSTKKDYSQIININTANAKELTKLKGINSEKYAEIIIKYRNDLGGFIKKEQLQEVWNLKIETYNDFFNQIDLGNNLPKQININVATTEDLKAHPYIDWNLAKSIINFRKNHGSYKDVNDIKQNHLVTDEIYTKIAPYLTVK